MNKIKYVVTSGCSFSDGACMSNDKSDRLKYRFSKILADGLSAQDINLAKSGGSNDRAFRKIYEWIQENPKKMKYTLFLIGFTNLHRKDLYFDYEKRWIGYSKLGSVELNHFYKNVDKKMIKTWNDIEYGYFYSDDIEKEKLFMKADLLQTYVKSLNSNIIYFYALTNPKMIKALNNLDERLNWYKPGGHNYWGKYIKEYRSYSGGHPNKEYHIKLGKDLVKTYG
ncbi:hypothetical protein CMI47_00035 [Candidatus Pacearchaeota archaeon]|nr:hypothetical protein [Candidatus Pacearchaeota archaeon]